MAMPLMVGDGLERLPCDMKYLQGWAFLESTFSYYFNS